MEDIIYIVEADIEEDEVIEWEDYQLMAHEFGFPLPNLMAWHRGCPRTPKEVFDKLQGLKADLDKAVEEEKERIKNEPPRNPILDKRLWTASCQYARRTSATPTALRHLAIS